MTWKRAVTSLAALLCMPVALADSPAPERQYSVTSTDGMYEFTMYPTVRDGAATTQPYGEAYRASSEDGLAAVEKELLWRIDGWYSFETFISNGGRNLVRIGPWASLPQTEELAVAFYRDGIEQRRYVVSDLIENADAVERSVSHYNWQKRDSSLPRLLADGRFQLRTVEDRTITFDVATGEILSGAASPDSPAPMPQVTREDADGRYHASLLLRENGINIDEDSIRRVVRRSDKTIVWVVSKFAGLPVFDHELRYSFGADRKVDVPSGPGRESSRGKPLPPASSFPIDHRPDIDPEQAAQSWLNRVRSEEFFGPDYEPRNDPETVLGFHNLHIGTGGEPEYRLAWRVRSRGGRYPLAMVSAKKGDILFFDSGVRTGSFSAPEPASNASRFVGTWHAAPCGERRYNRRLMLAADGTFSTTEVIPSCPQAVCVSDINVRAVEYPSHRGTWRVRNARMIELTTTNEQRSRDAEPMPGAMGFDSSSGRLHEATPGASRLCEYRRIIGGASEPGLPDPNSEAASTCHDAVQGNIAWDYRGRKRWQDKNLNNLCAGAAESTEPARCFETAMHGDVERGDGSVWIWEHAIELCSGTLNADETLKCFQREISEGHSWPEAIASCRTDLEPHMSASIAAPENERVASPYGGYLAGRCRDAGEQGPIMANEKVCAAKRAEEADRQLAELYAGLREDIEQDLTGVGAADNAAQLQGLLDSLTSSQAGWTQYRDATCRFAYFQYFPGSMAKLEEFECRKSLADHRIEQLKNISTQAGEGIEY